MNRTRSSRTLMVVLALALAGLTAVLAVLLHGAWRAEAQAQQRNIQAALAATVRRLEADEITGHAVRFITAEVDSCAAPGEGEGLAPIPAGPGTYVVAGDSLRVVHLRDERTAGTRLEVFATLDTTVADTMRLGLRTRLIERLVGDLVQQEPRSISQRLTVGRVDSVLTANLRELDIEAEPRFSVVDAVSGEPMLANVADPAALAGSTAPRVRLFPLDVVGPRYDLVVGLPGADARILAKIWPLGAASAAFLLVVVFSFAHALRALERERRTAAQVVGFINNMTHEFKTPLATVSLACQTLERRGPDADTARYVRMIGQETDRLGRQVEKILQVAQLQEGAIMRGTEAVDLAAVARASAAAFALQAERRAGALATRLPDGPVPVTGDPLHLAAIVDNLLDNAVKYADAAPQVELTLRVTGAAAELTVADRGPGIAPHDQERLFEPYFRCATGNRHDVKGYGLGLGFVKLLAELHDGGVALRSRLGRGTTVTVTLPLAGTEEPRS